MQDGESWPAAFIITVISLLLGGAFLVSSSRHQELLPPWLTVALTDRALWDYLGRCVERLIRDPPEREFLPKDENILLIGNSYTGYYQLDKLTQSLFLCHEEQEKQQPGIQNNNNVNVESHFPPGQTFEGHLKTLDNGNGLLHKWLISQASTRNWKWIVLQNHSLEAGLCQHNTDNHREIFDQSLVAARRLHKIIARHNPSARVVFFMTWGRRTPSKGRFQKEYSDFETMQEHISYGYQRYVAATSTSEQPTYLAPVGLVFRTIYWDDKKKAVHAAAADTSVTPPKDPSEDPNTLFYQLLDREGHHPALPGSYAAAVTLFATLTGQDVIQLTWKPDNLEETVAIQIRDAVRRTIQETIDQDTIRYPWQQHQQQ